MAATSKISEFNSATDILDNELIAVVVGGVTKKITLANLRTAIARDLALTYTVTTTNNYQMIAGEHAAVDSSGGALTIKLPTSPDDGDTATVRAVGGSVITNNVTVDRNGNNINGAAQDFVIQAENYEIRFVFIDGYGWVHNRNAN